MLEKKLRRNAEIVVSYSIKEINYCVKTISTPLRFSTKHSKIYRDISKNNYIFYIEKDTVKKL